jgi:hypothetical protein
VLFFWLNTLLATAMENILTWLLVLVHLLEVNPHVQMIGVFQTQEGCNVAVDTYKNISGRFPINTVAVCVLTDKASTK